MSKSKRLPVEDDTRELLSYRAGNVEPKSINAEERSVEVLLTTEAPVPMFDWERYEMVPEVLLTSGAILPASRQVPLLDSHQRYSTSTQLGSIRNLKKTEDGIVGREFFSSTAETEWTKVREGHVTDASAGYQVLERTFIPKGQKQNIAGREYSGPVSVVTKWRLREGSITPIGADEQAKMRGLDLTQRPNFSKEKFKMNEELRALCIANGMPETTSDEDAVRWAKDNLGKREAPKPEPQRTESGLDEDKIRSLAEAAAKAALEGEQTRREAFRKEVDTACELAGLPGERSACHGLKTIEEVRTHLINKRKEVDAYVPGSIRMPEKQPQDMHREALGTALTLRALENTGAAKKFVDEAFPETQRSKDAERYKSASMFNLAEECLRSEGIDTRYMNREQIAKAALGFLREAGVRSDVAYHTTGSFVYLTQDAINKSLMVGYTEVQPTWKQCFRQGASVQDFKTIHRIRMGALPNLPIWPDNRDPEKASLKDAQENYAVEARALEIGFSWRLLVNDDMDAIGRSPSMSGAAAARTVNALAWSQITANALMGDGVALFSAATGARKRSNLTTGVGAPSVATRQTLTNLMRQMRGENTPEGNESSDILNLTPSFLVGPSALETDINQLILSIYDPAKTNSIVYNPARSLTPIIEPLLDASSTTAWYLFASTSQIDTVEVTFLAGQESPVTNHWTDQRTLSQNFTIIQTFGAKALNHRGMQKHAGA